METSNGNLVSSLLKILSCFLEAYKETEIKKISAEELEHLEENIESVFYWSLVWSLGCTTDLSGREKFNIFLRERLTKAEKSIFPSEGSVYDYEFVEKESRWVPWTDECAKF